MATPNLTRNDRIWVTGHTGLLGHALVTELREQGYLDVITASHGELDLCDASATEEFVRDLQPKAIIHCAARVGGIQANSAFPSEFITENLKMQTNVIETAHRADVHHVVLMGSNCMYPLAAKQPMMESELFQGPIEPSNLAYGVAKMAGLVQTDSYRKQYGRRYFCVIPASLYGPHDCFNPERSHVTAALMVKFHAAKKVKQPSVEFWGTGKPLRELMFSRDAARGIITLLEKYEAEKGAVNLGTGKEWRINEIAEQMATAVGYEGHIKFDHVHADGNPRKLLDSTKAFSYGIHPRVSLAEGLKLTYDWFLDSPWA